MPAFSQILEKLLKCIFWHRQQLLFRFFFYLLNLTKTLSFYRCLQFCKRKKSTRVKSAEYGELRHDYGFVFGPKLKYRHRCVSWCVIIVQNHWMGFPQFFAFLMNWFAHWRITCNDTFPDARGGSATTSGYIKKRYFFEDSKLFIYKY